MMNQKTFLNTISRYFNTAVLSPTDKILSSCSPHFPVYRNAPFIKNAYASLNYQPNSYPEEIIEVKKYTGNDFTTLEIIAYLNKYLSEDLEYAIVHGSIATDEKINYSDFDGLVVIKNNVFQSVEKIRYVAEHLSKSYSLMIKGDPLQHHGWFVLTEKDLLRWPCSYFPPVILNYSRSLLKKEAIFSIIPYDNQEDCRLSLQRMSSAIIKTLGSGKFPGNAYQLKSLLSEFMLLPTLFLQSYTGKGIYKKNSFAEARKYFTESDWKIMDEISEIRENWNINSGFIMTEKTRMVTPGIKKKQIKCSPAIPDQLQRKLNNELIHKMKLLINNFLSKNEL